MKSISIDDNLTSNRIKALEIDSLNTLWIGSNLGLHSYNNDNIVTHNFFIGKEIESIYQLRKGEVIILTNSGLYHYSYVNNKNKQIGSDDIKFTSIHLHDKKLYLTDNKNNIYCYNDSLTMLFGIQNLIPNLPEKAVLSGLFINSEGKIILTLNNYGVVTINPDDFRIENTYKTTVWKYVKIIEYNQRIYIASYSGVLVFQTNGEFVQAINKTKGNLPGNIIMDLCVNSERNEVWLVLDNFGIYAVNNKLETYSISNLANYKDFKNKSITSIRIDKNNNIYAGTVYEGVIIAVNSAFKEIISKTPNNSFKPLVLALVKDSNNTFWCGSDNVGLFSVDSLGHIESFFSEKFRIINFVASLSEDELLVAVYNDGIYHFNKKTGKYSSLNQVDRLKKIRARENSKIFEDRNKNIWISSDSLYCIEANRKSVKTIKSFYNEKYFRPDRFSQDPLGRLWFVSRSHLLCYNIANNKYEYVRETEIPRNHQDPICAGKQGEIVLISKNTIYKIDTNTNEVVTLDFPVRDRSAVSTFYHEENDTYIFMTTKDIITAKLSDSLTNVSIVNTSSFDSRMYFSNSSFIAENNIYAGYDGGICSFNVHDLFKTTKNEDIILLQLQGYNARYYNVRDTSFVLYNENDEIKFRRPVSHYTFTFQGKMIANLNQVKYKYMLEGIDKDWTLTERNKVDYNRLKPGNYVFRVKSVDNRGIEGKETILRIKISAPILISKFFIGIYVLLLAGILIFLIYHLYKKVLKSKVVVDWNIPGESKVVVTDNIVKEEEFINKFKSVVEANISNCDLHVDEIAQELHVSRTVLYEKVKKISGYSVKAFINTIRLEKAKRMLENPKSNINDISFECGFNSASYFSTAFKNSFEISPSKYRNDYLKQNTTSKNLSST